VTPINLAVPLKVSSSKKLSDKYLELEKNKTSSHSKKSRSKKDDGKKKKKKKDKPDVEGKWLIKALLNYCFLNLCVLRETFGFLESSDEETITVASPEVISTMELPDGARLSDSDNDDGHSETDPHRALNIDLEEYIYHL